MVKNFKGGNKSKGFARKSLLTTHSSSLRFPTSPLEHFAIVTHFYGTMCDVLTLNQQSFKCHIRGKFRGRNKRSSLISVGSIILIGSRDFQSDSRFTDLLEIYDPASLPSLFLTPGYDFSPFISLINHSSPSIHNHSPIDPLIDHLFIQSSHTTLDDPSFLSHSTIPHDTIPPIDSFHLDFHNI
jgi:translation initiation factor IF-1